MVFAREPLFYGFYYTANTAKPGQPYCESQVRPNEKSYEIIMFAGYVRGLLPVLTKFAYSTIGLKACTVSHPNNILGVLNLVGSPLFGAPSQQKKKQEDHRSSVPVNVQKPRPKDQRHHQVARDLWWSCSVALSRRRRRNRSCSIRVSRPRASCRTRRGLSCIPCWATTSWASCSCTVRCAECLQAELCASCRVCREVGRDAGSRVGRFQHSHWVMASFLLRS